MTRTLNEILQDADRTTNLDGLIALWNELVQNKYKYPLCELYFAAEHIAELTLKSQGSCVEKNLFYRRLTAANKHEQRLDTLLRK